MGHTVVRPILLLSDRSICQLLRKYKLPVSVNLLNSASGKASALIVEFDGKLCVAVAQGVVHFLVVVEANDL